MFGFSHRFLLMICAVVYHGQAQNSPTSSSGNARNGKGCIRVETAPFGNIVSPDYMYGKKYPPSTVCKWTIKAAVGNTIYLYFNDFLIEKSRSCKNDYLLLFDGPNDSSRMVGRYCETSPAEFTSSANYIHIEFYSDISVEFRGFYATYNTSLATTVKPTEWRSKPQFLNTVLNMTVVEGKVVQLICEVDGTPKPVITWKKDSQNLLKDQRIVVKESPFESIVTINKVSKRDQGRYTCTADNGVGSAISSQGWLVVMPRVLPLITKPTANKTVTVGSKVKLVCVANGQPPMKIVWKENDRALANENCHQRSGCKIRITKMFVQDTVVTCEVANKAGTVSRNVHISVRGPPLITHAPKDQTLETGLYANFTCVAMGQPPLKISWKKNDKMVSDGVSTAEGRSFLTFKVTRNTTVTCTVEGQRGTTSKQAQLIVAEKKKLPPGIPPTFVIVPENLNVDHNASASLSCQAKGYPEPQISWSQDGTDVTKAAVMSDGVSILMLKSIVKTVTVVCMAKNNNGTIRSTAKITVLSAQSISGSKSGDFDNNLKLIIGAGGGVLLLTIIIIIVLVVRLRKRNKDVETDSNRPETAKENENLILNPLSNKENGDADAQPGIEMLHFPREDIAHCEDIENGANVQIFLGRASDLPFASGDYNVVVKVLKDTAPSEEKRRDFDFEAALLANLVHPNVVRLMAVCIKTTPLSLVFEHSEYGCLEEYLQDCDPNDFAKKGKKRTGLVRDSFTELGNVDRLFIAKQVASGMQYLAEKGYIHQELRARNCLVFSDMQVKVANLGLRWANPEQNFYAMEPSEKQNFPVRWLPPEVVLYGEYSESSDVWSYGVLVWEIFSDGQLPYTGINDNEVVSYVRGHNVLPRPKPCPPDVYEVLKSCWEMTPLERPRFGSMHKTMTSLHAGVPV